MAEGLKINVFKELITNFNSKNIWAYKGLSLKYIPYILLTCREKFKKKEDLTLSNQSLFFILETDTKYADDLWNKQSSMKQNLWKVDENGDVEGFLIDDNWIIELNWFKKTSQFVEKIF